MDIARHRLVNQRLGEPVFGRAAEVVSWMGAVQAQDFAAAKWALGMRLNDSTDSTVEEAFNQGAILRTHVMRPTWHFVTPADIRWLLALTAARARLVSVYQFKKLELDSAFLNRTADAIVEELRERGCWTRSELSDALEARGISTKGPLRMIYILMHAELERLTCNGPRRGKQFTYALLDERVSPESPLSFEEALAELARRFFASHGPATVQDMAKWSGLRVQDVKAGLESVKSEFMPARVNERNYWFSPALESKMAGIRETHLVPVYDEYTVGYKFHVPVFDSVNYSMLIFLNPVVIDGMVSGTWRRVDSKSSVLAQVNTFKPPTEQQRRALRESAGRLGAFLEKPVEIEWR